MYENGQGHLTLFCIVFVWLRGRPSTVRSPIQDPWFMYQNWLGPSGGIYYPNFVPCFVYHYLNVSICDYGKSCKVIPIRYRSRFFGQVGHQTTSAYIENKAFFHYIMSSSDLPKLLSTSEKMAKFLFFHRWKSVECFYD